MEWIKLTFLKFFTRKIREHNKLQLGQILYRPVYTTDKTQVEEVYEKVGVITELRIRTKGEQQGDLLVTIER